MFKIKIFILTSILLSSCSRVSTLSLKPHTYNQLPTKIIWMQLPGLSDEHLALLKFDEPSSRSSFENASCVGKMWNYDLFSLRPSARSTLLSQMTGSKNIKGSCSDFKHRPIWNYLNHSVGVLESGVEASSSLTGAWKCPEANEFKKKISLWSMSADTKKINSSMSFHYQDLKKSQQGQVYYDLTCKKKGCYSGLTNNVKSIWKKEFKKKGESLMIIRDFSYLTALKQRNILKAKEVLSVYEKLHSYLREELKRVGEPYLLIVSSSNSQRFEFPRKGREWKEYQASGKGVIFRSSSLASPVYVEGARSENFCGFYEQSDILKRILWGPKQSKIKRLLFN